MSKRIGTVGVIGAGTMGSGIAQKLAQEGASVVLVDRGDADLERGLERIRALLDEAVERRIFSRDRADEVLGRISTTTDYDGLAGVDLVIEAVFEDLGVKREVFGRLSEVVGETCVLATNTSSFFVRDVADAVARPERVLGLHYFYHPAKNRLVEVVAHDGTDPDALARVWAYQERVGKTPIACADAPGFCVNRFFVPWLNEAVRLLADGVAGTAAIDRVAREAFRIGMGPFALMNVTGVPIALHAATTLGRELGDFYAPSPRLAQQVEAGELWSLDDDDGCGAAAEMEVRDRLLGVVFYVAAKLVEDGVASIEDTDLGARVGLRWASGPFELVNRTGPGDAARMAAKVIEPYGLELPKALAERSETATPFPISHVRLDRAGDVATITINRPDAMNALDETVVGQLAERFEQAKALKGVRAVVIRGAGKAFVAGADVRWFVRQIEGSAIDHIVEFTKAGQKLLASFAEAEPVVIAFVDGLSLGGGSELALACDYIVATGRGSFGFPETSIGIYPGLGGTQRLPRRVGRGLARYLVFSGRPIGAKDGQGVGLVDRLIEADALDETVRDLVEVGKPEARAPAETLPAPWQERAEAFDHPAAELVEGRHAAQDEKLRKAQLSLRRKAPIALHMADELLAGALETPLVQGLENEVTGLPMIFATDDALAGLRSVGGRERPTFRGA